jgi:hypothetical protein
VRDQSITAGYPPAEERGSRTSVAKVLIIDDEPNIREVVGLRTLWRVLRTLTGEALGSDDQSWTAAVALDWLADEEPEEKPA